MRRRFVIIIVLGAIVIGYFIILSALEKKKATSSSSMYSGVARFASGKSWIKANAVIQGLSALPKVIPKSLIAQVGSVAHYRCTARNEEPVYWRTKPYGSEEEHYVNLGEKRLIKGYERFPVEFDNTLRRNDLVIKDIKQSDGGVYICIDKRGSGKEASAELVVWDTLTCQVDQQQDSSMREKVSVLDQEKISFTCRMNYTGNIRPQFVWSAGGRKFNGTQRNESGIASSSLILTANSKLDGAKVTCEAAIRDSSSEDSGTGDLWTSDTIRVKYSTYQILVLVLSCALVCSIAGFVVYFILKKRFKKKGETRNTLLRA